MPVRVCCRFVPVSESATGNDVDRVQARRRRRDHLRAALQPGQAEPPDLRRSETAHSAARGDCRRHPTTLPSGRPQDRDLVSPARLRRSGVGSGAGSTGSSGWTSPGSGSGSSDQRKAIRTRSGAGLVPPAGLVLVEQRVLEADRQPLGLLGSQPELPRAERHRPGPFVGPDARGGPVSRRRRPPRSWSAIRSSRRGPEPARCRSAGSCRWPSTVGCARRRRRPIARPRPTSPAPAGGSSSRSG